MNSGMMNKIARQKQTAVSSSAHDLYGRMAKKIDFIISKIARFNTCCDWDDYRQEAYLACREAVLKYRQGTGMSLDTYAYWIISRRLYNIADTGEAWFAVSDGDGVQVDLLPNSAWRASKVSLEKQEYRGEYSKQCLLFSEMTDWWKDASRELDENAL